MEKLEKYLDKFTSYIESEKFEKKSEKYTWWFIYFAIGYFTIRFLVGVLFGV